MQPIVPQNEVPQHKTLVVFGIICLALLTLAMTGLVLLLAAFACFKSCGPDDLESLAQQRNLQYAAAAVFLAGVGTTGFSIARFQRISRSNSAYLFLIPILIVGATLVIFLLGRFV